MLGPSASWKTDEQRRGMESIISVQAGQMLIVVLPTGGGKSIFFMLPSLLEWGTNIVIVPFVALIEDLVARAKQLSIDCIQWQSADSREGPQRRARLVVVSADVATTDGFTAYMMSLQACGLLRRIFIDECHTVMVDAGYRKRLRELGTVGRYGCPIVLLTATLPVRLERWFRELMHAEDAQIIRASTVKRNIRYRVVQLEGGWDKMQDEVVQLVITANGRMTGDQKGVVYCRSVAKCEALAEKLGCSCYHSRMAAEARADALRKWREGNRGGGTSGHRWIVATTGLGTGVDIAGIVAVVHMEQPYSMVDFVQQTGRGGRRAGEVVESTVVADVRGVGEEKQVSDMEHMNRQAMEQFIKTRDCRRVGLGLFMDGRGADCREVAGELCDRCCEEGGQADQAEGLDQGLDKADQEMDQEVDQGLDQADQGLDEAGQEISQESGRGPASGPASESITSVIPAVVRYTKEKQQRRLAHQQWLEAVEGKCTVCYLGWCMRGRLEEEVEGIYHRFEECWIIRFRDYRAWKRGLQFGLYSCCWECGLPQSFRCRERGGCEWRDTVLPAVLWAFWGPLKRQVSAYFGLEWDEAGYQEWVGRDRLLDGEEATNAIAVWDYLVRHVCR